MDARSRPDYHAQAAGLFGAALAALAVAGLVGDPAHRQSLIAWMDLSGAKGQRLEPFRFALDMEQAYADRYLGLGEAEDGGAPHYEGGGRLDLGRLARLFDVDRILCVVLMTERGAVVGGRDYEGLDLAYVSEAAGEMARLAGMLGRRGPSPAGRPN